jgi:hypothetical protein
VVDVSIVMPCLDECRTLAHCIEVAQRALDVLKDRHGLAGEIVIADNGSSDGSQELASPLGARVVTIRRRGYGAAVCGGFSAARGRYLVMGDADGSYDFVEAVPMVEALMNGADLCMGSRFKGAIKPGAMPWKNRYIGNPVLTGILNVLFHAGVDDAHCGLRALTTECFERLRLEGSGMELASEMIIKAALLGQRIAEVPVTLWPDRRDRPPHLRPWRDGWRHLRYLLMLSPTWVFAVPATFAGAVSLAIWAYAAVATFLGASATSPIGNQWIILAGAMIGLSHIAGLLAAATHLYGTSQGYRRPAPWAAPIAQWISLESMLASGLAVAASGFAILLTLFSYWTQHGYTTIGTVLPAVTGTTLIVVGAQNVLGGFLLAIISGHEAEFLKNRPECAPRLANPRAHRREPKRAASG